MELTETRGKDFKLSKRKSKLRIGLDSILGNPLHCEAGETLENVFQRSCGFPIPRRGSRVGWSGV